ncbi:MAG TPA: organomercurial lyase [Candidatus Angelobacter sp.]
MHDAEFNSQVRLEIYRQFIEKQSCPSKTDVAHSLCALPEEITRAYAELADAHMLVLQPGNGEVLMANPLSAVPTPFVVETWHPEGMRKWYGNCIWDALGVISMLATDGRVLTSCGCCGEKMVVEVKSKRPFSRPEGIVHFALPARHWWDDIVFN